MAMVMAMARAEVENKAANKKFNLMDEKRMSKRLWNEDKRICTAKNINENEKQVEILLPNPIYS